MNRRARQRVDELESNGVEVAVCHVDRERTGHGVATLIDVASVTCSLRETRTNRIIICPRELTGAIALEHLTGTVSIPCWECVGHTVERDRGVEAGIAIENCCARNRQLALCVNDRSGNSTGDIESESVVGNQKRTVHGVACHIHIPAIGGGLGKIPCAATSRT